MSLEMIKDIVRTEDDGKTRIEQAKLNAKKLVEEAEAQGKALLAKIDSEALSESKELLQKAEARAEVRCREILDEAKAKGAAIQKDAETRLEEAASLIVERVAG